MPTATALPTGLDDNATVVNEFLRAGAIADPILTPQCMAPGLHIRFTGGRPRGHPAECSAFNADRWRRVKPRIERTDVVSSGTSSEKNAESTIGRAGTLQGEWLAVRAGLATP